MDTDGTVVTEGVEDATLFTNAVVVLKESVTEEIDLTDKISLNKPFLVIMGFVCIVQIIMTYFGGAILRTAGLNPKEWVVVIVLALLIIPVDIARKVIMKWKR